MTSTVKLLAGLIAVVAALLWLWSLDGSTEVLPSGESAVAPAKAPAAVAGDQVQRDAPVVDRSAPAPAAVAAVVDRAPAFDYSLLCRVVDSDGLPVEGAPVAFAPRGCALNGWPSSTGADGAVRLQWRAKL